MRYELRVWPIYHISISIACASVCTVAGLCAVCHFNQCRVYLNDEEISDYENANSKYAIALLCMCVRV